MFNIKKLKNITLADKNLLEPYLNALNEFSCEMSFANLVMWHEAYKTQFAFDDKNRLILYSPVEKMIYFPRGNCISPAELADLSKNFSELALTDGTIYDIPQYYIDQNPDIYDFFDIDLNADNFDYIYDNQHLANCDGSKLRKKRNLIKQFIQANPHYSIIQLDENSASRFLALSERLNSYLEPCDFLSDENKVIKFACAKFRTIGLDGILLNDGQNDAGYSIWSRLNSDVADIHFEKADHSIKGAAQFLTRQCAEILAQSNIKYMNREQDLGSEGIRRAKHSLDPSFLYRRYTLHTI